MNDVSSPQPPQTAAAAALPEPRYPIRLRFSRIGLAPLVIGAICAIPLAATLGPWGLLVLVPFVLIAVALWRLGADITAEDVVVRSALSSTRVARSELAGFEVPDGRHVHLLRTDGSTVRLPYARPRDLPRLRTLLFDIPMPPEEPAI